MMMATRSRTIPRPSAAAGRRCSPSRTGIKSSNPETLGDFLADNPVPSGCSGGSGSWVNADLGIPGNFAWLSRSTAAPTAELRDEMARAGLSSCIFIDGAEVDQTTNPGQPPGGGAGLNVRFDVLRRSRCVPTDWRHQRATTRPRANVIHLSGGAQRHQGRGCRTTAMSAMRVRPTPANLRYSGLPQDSCFATDTCSDVWGNPGVDDRSQRPDRRRHWDAVRYFAANHYARVFRRRRRGAADVDGAPIVDPATRVVNDQAAAERWSTRFLQDIPRLVAHKTRPAPTRPNWCSNGRAVGNQVSDRLSADAPGRLSVGTWAT